MAERKNVLLDFSKTRKIDSSGMLVIVAEIDRAQRMGGHGQRFFCKLPDDACEETRIVRQVLDQIDLLDRVNHPPIHEEKSHFHSSVKNWRYATGTRVNEEPGDVLEKHEGRIAPALMQKMQIGLMEAITNSLHHAYMADRNDECGPFSERRWWMFTHEADGLLQVIVCDLGIGISRSLPIVWKKHFLRRFSSLFSGEHPDVAAINIALLLGESSTKENHRGKGMHQIWNAVHESHVGGVAISSGKGHVWYNAKEGRLQQGAFGSEFMGTLISWQVSIESEAAKTDE
ncbi:MAG: hypothetical protein AB7E05_14195 [Sphingobium sp.]